MMAQAACDLADVVRRCLCHEAMGSGGQAGEKEVTRREHCRRVTRLTHAVSAAKRVSSITPTRNKIDQAVRIWPTNQAPKKSNQKE